MIYWWFVATLPFWPFFANSVEDLYKGPIICTGRQYAGTAIWYQLLSLPVPSLQTRVLPRILPLNLTDSFSSKIFDPRYFTESVSHSCWTMPRAIYAASQFASQIGGADGAARHRWWSPAAARPAARGDSRAYVVVRQVRACNQNQLCVAHAEMRLPVKPITHPSIKSNQLLYIFFNQTGI